MKEAGYALNAGMLSQSTEADFDECCELLVWHGTWNGFVPEHWVVGGGLVAAETPTCFRKSDGICGHLLRDQETLWSVIKSS